MAEQHTLRRYTDLPALIYLLSNRRITLVDPLLWDDANDSRCLAIYKKRKSLGTVLALCFTYSPETYHHWRVFAHGSGGVCITFDKNGLLTALTKQEGISYGDVQYSQIASLREKPPFVEHLPFLKRKPYEPELEFRVVYECTNEEKKFLDVPIPLSCVERITLSPWLKKNIADSVRGLLRTVPGCSSKSITRTTLINNEQFQKYGEAAIDRPS